MSEEVQRDESAPKQVDGEVPAPDQPEQRTVHLPSLIADEYGMSLSEARRLTQVGTVTVDEEPVKYQMDLPADEIEGKTIKVTDGTKTVQFQYRTRRDTVTGDIIG